MRTASPLGLRPAKRLARELAACARRLEAMAVANRSEALRAIRALLAERGSLVVGELLGRRERARQSYVAAIAALDAARIKMVGD